VHRLVATTGCPTIDAELARFADVVLRADREVAVLLRYSLGFRRWYACGCLAVEAVGGKVVPNPDMYWRGVGYLEDAAYCYKIFHNKPLRAYRNWNRFYNRIAQRHSLRLMRD
jgi:hypothetical protein